jgi:hypothetical protein
MLGSGFQSLLSFLSVGHALVGVLPSGKHFAALHMLEVGLENLRSRPVDILAGNKRKRDGN